MNECCEEVKIENACDEIDAKLETWVNKDGSMEMHVKMVSTEAFKKIGTIMNSLFEYYI